MTTIPHHQATMKHPNCYLCNNSWAGDAIIYTRIISPHTKSFCSMCGDMVICATCGNHTCNCGRGETISVGVPCPDCEQAYEHAAMCSKHHVAFIHTDWAIKARLQYYWFYWVVMPKRHVL